MLPEIFADVTAPTRVGEVLRTSQWWEEHLADAALARTPTEFAVIDEDGVRGGYIAFVRPASSDLGQVRRRRLIVQQQMTAMRRRALLAFVQGDSTDGGETVTAARATFRRHRRARRLLELMLEPSPQLWLRLLDVAQAALSFAGMPRPCRARCSRCVDELLESEPRVLPVLETYGGAGPLSWSPLTSDAAAITLDIADLARIFLGGVERSASWRSVSE